MAVVVAALGLRCRFGGFIDVDPSGLGVVSAGKGLSAGGDGKGDAADTDVSMDG